MCTIFPAYPSSPNNTFDPLPKIYSCSIEFSRIKSRISSIVSGWTIVSAGPPIPSVVYDLSKTLCSIFKIIASLSKKKDFSSPLFFYYIVLPPSLQWLQTKKIRFQIFFSFLHGEDANTDIGNALRQEHRANQNRQQVSARSRVKQEEERDDRH